MSVKEHIIGKVILAPMAGITDRAFREICIEQGADFVYTEMISAKALNYNDHKTKSLLITGEEEKPYGIQIFGSEPEVISEAVKRLGGENHSILDINMGCPAPKVVKNGDGAALMLDPLKAEKIMDAAVKASDRDVTAKIRLGWDDHRINYLEIAKRLEAKGAKAITLHGRTREQFYSGKAFWEPIRTLKEALSIPVIGNGDIFSFTDAENLLKQTAVEAIMIGRGVRGNPFIFNEIKQRDGWRGVSSSQMKKVILRHMEKIVEYKGIHRGVQEMRKHLGWYLKGKPGSGAIKNSINQTKEYSAMRNIVEELF